MRGIKIINSSYTLKRWERDESSALEIHDLLKRAIPLAPPPPRERVFDLFQSFTKNYPRGTWLAMCEDQLMGVIMMMRGPSPQRARVAGAVDPEHWRSGVGSALWSTLLDEINTYPEVRQLQARTFE